MQHFAADRAVTEFGPGFDAVGQVDQGETFTVETADCYDGQLADPSTLRPQIDMARFNRASGPVAVRGIEPDEAVAVSIEDVDLAPAGVMALAPGLGLLGEDVETATTRVLEVRDGHAWLTPEVAVPLRPMVGILGAATAEERIPTSTPGVHGGNLDTRIIRPGATVMLRARQPGLGLAVGDLHAAMGDGELGGTGIEIGGTVRLRIDRVADYDGAWPAVVDDDGLHILASGAPFERAARAAFREAVALMARWQDLSWPDAYRLTSVVGDLQVSQLVNPQVTARMSIPGRWVSDDVLAVRSR
ncbi:acetamidase/formamidase family protein [Georgenia deserti]|uniref:Acetamidase/formamidase family protein n=1 Tax=Georgenia deserti TaxID=2093781 RepID=A0ABW4L3F8_9MICO